ncbi:MAG TPA: DUF1295 domain-containing protein [Sulfurimonas sp.]|nr:DUF1295 domain-containing protein [Sulfurimonas sp.]
MKKMIGYSLVFSQFLLIFIMTLPFGTPVNNLFIALFVIAIGLVIGVLALYSNRYFNIRPDIKGDAPLVHTGVYAYIRHPMYAAVLTVMFGVTLLYPTTFIFVSYALLVCTLLIKMFYEESLWKVHHDEYTTYMKSSKRLIPFIF